MNFKGVAPLVATVLLIAMALLIAGILMSWTTTLTKETTSSVSNRTGGVVDCTGSSIEIQSVFLDFTANKSRVLVRNSGQRSDNIISGVMQNNNGDTLNNLTVLPISIGRSEQKMVEFNMTGKITACTNFSQVVISSDCLYDTYNKKPTNC